MYREIAKTPPYINQQLSYMYRDEAQTRTFSSVHPATFLLTNSSTYEPNLQIVRVARVYLLLLYLYFLFFNLK